MKKSKLVLLSLVFIVLLGLGLIFGSVEVKAAGETPDTWGCPLLAKEFIDRDGHGIRMFARAVYPDRDGGFLYVKLSPVLGYNFEGQELKVGSNYSIGRNYFDDEFIDYANELLQRWGEGVYFPESDRAYVYFDVDSQKFYIDWLGEGYLGYWIESSFDLIEENELLKEGEIYEVGYSDGYSVGYADGTVNGYNDGYYVGREDGFDEGYDVGRSEGYEIGYTEGYDVGNEDGYEAGYGEGYDVAYNEAYPGKSILLITLILYILAMFLYFKFGIKWILIATILLWFVPIFLVHNMFVKIFAVIMIIVTIVITFFNNREEEYLE